MWFGWFITINTEALLHHPCNSYSLSDGCTGADAYLIGKLQFWQFLNFPVVAAGGDEQRACWPWTHQPQFVNISPCFLPPNFPLQANLLTHQTTCGLSAVCPGRFKSFGDPEGGFWLGIRGYRLLCACGRVNRGVRFWLIEDRDPLRGSCPIHRPNWFTSALSHRVFPVCFPFFSTCGQSMGLVSPLRWINLFSSQV